MYPGENGSFLLYQDDGATFQYRQGEWMGLRMEWNDVRKTLSLKLERGSKLSGARQLAVTLAGATRQVTFEGRPLEVRF